MNTNDPRHVGDIYLAFYIAKTGNLWDKTISLVDGTKYSHVELAVVRDDGRCDCYTSHSAEGGVRAKVLSLNPAKWDLFRINDIDLKYALEVFEREKARKYDWMGLISTKINWFPGSDKRWFCSELVAAMLQIRRPQNQGIKDMLRWAERNSK